MAYTKVEKKSFLIYYDNYQNISGLLDDENLGQWLRYIAEYEINGVIPEPSDSLMAYIVRDTINRLDRDKEKYYEEIRRRTKTAHVRELNKWNITGFKDSGEINFKTGKDKTTFCNKFGSVSAKDIDKEWLTWAYNHNWTIEE